MCIRISESLNNFNSYIEEEYTSLVTVLGTSRNNSNCLKVNMTVHVVLELMKR